jgi:hypothetical protein
VKEAATINFQDASSSDEAVVVVRYDEKSAVVGISRKSDGDMEVALDQWTANSLPEALRKAIE